MICSREAPALDVVATPASTGDLQNDYIGQRLVRWDLNAQRLFADKQFEAIETLVPLPAYQRGEKRL
jgi:hypothetical protein